MQEYETIIVGAGPAGLVAGRSLTDYLILEKKREIGRPVRCGEVISAGALRNQQIECDDAWVNSRIHRVKRVMPNGKFFGSWHEEPVGYIVDRAAFEQYLARPLMDRIRLGCGADKLQFANGRWRILTTTGESLTARYIIGADGANSVVRRAAFRESQDRMTFYPAIEYLVEVERELNPSESEMFFDNERHVDGYAWVFPKSKNTANIGIGGRRIRMSDFKEFLEETVRPRYGEHRLLTNKSGVVPIAEPCVRVFKSNAFLTGDAGGFADPLMKGGMNQAMVSARIAAECISSNETRAYEERLRASGILNRRMHRASKVFYSFSNDVFNELGGVLENRGTSYLKTFKGIGALVSRPVLRKNLVGLFVFFRAWWKSRDYSW
jgi:digeranylgeranylglycerophospholipid reductase